LLQAIQPKNYPSMPLLPYSLARPFLFGLEPEAAHDLTLESLARLQGTPLAWAWCSAMVDDPVQLAGLRFPNRVGLAAGLDKNARCIDGLGAMGFGFVEVGTVTPKPQPGNPKPRMFRLPQANALINRLGFNNDGLDAFLANVKRSSFRSRGRILGLNIGKNAATPIEDATRDYLTGLEGVYPHADYVTVNFSSPNPRTCARCSPMKRWTRCWAPSRSAGKRWRRRTAAACRCSSRSRPTWTKRRSTSSPRRCAATAWTAWSRPTPRSRAKPSGACRTRRKRAA
jgi:hypothetical protein